MGQKVINPVIPELRLHRATFGVAVEAAPIAR
jgi:hypothetical protein